MRRIAPIVLAVAAPAAFAQSPVVTTLLRENVQIGAGGPTVESIADADVNSLGRWGAIVQTTNPERTLVLDGFPVFSEGDTFGGAPIDALVDIEVSEDGTLALLFRVEDPADPQDPIDQILVDTDVVLAEGDTLQTGSIAGDVEVLSIEAFDVEGSDMAVACTVQRANGTTESLLLDGRVQLGAFVPQGGYGRNDPIPGLTRTFRSARELQRSTSGEFCSEIDAFSLTGAEPALLVGLNGVAEPGASAPAPNSTWDLAGRPRIRLAASGVVAIAGTVVLSSGVSRGALYRDSAPLALEGAPLNGVLAAFVAPFQRLPFDVADSGEVVFAVRTTSGTEYLMAGAEPLIRTGQTESSGETITGLDALLARDSVRASIDGKLAVVIGRVGVDEDAALMLVQRSVGEPTSCPVELNSIGQEGTLEATGSRFVSSNDLTLTARRLPPGQFGLLLASRNIGFVPNPGGSQGNLCLGGAIGRFNAQVQPSDPAGVISFDVDLTAIPQPSALVAAAPGDVWVFQTWHRDTSGGAPTSNYTGAVVVEML